MLCVGARVHSATSSNLTSMSATSVSTAACCCCCGASAATAAADVWRASGITVAVAAETAGAAVAAAPSGATLANDDVTARAAAVGSGEKIDGAARPGANGELKRGAAVERERG